MKKLVLVFLMSVLVFACKKEIDTTFLIGKDTIGKLSKESLVRDLEIIYARDSIVKDTSALNLTNNARRVRIFERGGEHLLTLTPSSDSIPKIENVRIEDSRFITEKGIGLNSTFKSIKDNYAIRKIITSMNNLVILLKDSDIYFTIDKKELPSSLQYSSSANIEAVQIPDEAKIKYLMIGWE